MIAIVAIAFVTAVMVGSIAAPGRGLFALFIVPVGIAVAVWLAPAARTGTGSREVASRASSRELGPGGLDDPAPAS